MVNIYYDNCKVLGTFMYLDASCSRVCHDVVFSPSSVTFAEYKVATDILENHLI